MVNMYSYHICSRTQYYSYHEEAPLLSGGQGDHNNGHNVQLDMMSLGSDSDPVDLSIMTDGTAGLLAASTPVAPEAQLDLPGVSVRNERFKMVYVSEPISEKLYLVI